MIKHSYYVIFRAESYSYMTRFFRLKISSTGVSWPRKTAVQSEEFYKTVARTRTHAPIKQLSTGNKKEIYKTSVSINNE